MTHESGREERREDGGPVRGSPSRAGRWARLRSRVRYGVSLRGKLVAPALVVGFLVVAALFSFAYLALRSSIGSIYEARARSVAAVVSKSIQEKDYVLYYSDKLDADIGRLLEEYSSIVEITIVGATARGFVTVASTDPTHVGLAADDAATQRFAEIRGVEVERGRLGEIAVLRVVQPIGSGAQRSGVVVVDMSLDEQAAYVHRLSWQFGAAAVVGFSLLGGLLYLILTVVVTRPVRRLARAAQAVAERRYDIETSLPADRTPGTPVRDEVNQLEEGFHLMTKVIHGHEQELRRLVLIDETTGAYNAQHFRAQLPVELSKGRRYGHPTSLLIIDLDGMDATRVAESDRIAIRATAYLVRSLRCVDTVFRLAAGRFAAILPETPEVGAVVAAERLRAFASDVTAASEPPVVLRVTPMGWAPEADVQVDDVVARLEEEGDHVA